MNKVWKTDLPSTQKMVLLAFASHCNEQGECYPHIETIANKCSLSTRAVQMALASLVKMGYVKRLARMDRKTLYSIQINHEQDSHVEIQPERNSPLTRTLFTPPSNNIHRRDECISPITTNITTNQSLQPQPASNQKLKVNDLIWPRCFNSDQGKEIALKKLISIGCVTKAQIVLDEISGNEKKGKTINYPQKYLDKLVDLLRSNTLSPELANTVKAQREAHNQFSGHAHKNATLKKADPRTVEDCLARIKLTYPVMHPFQRAFRNRI
jgi:hypothetical protein